jgi:hypothetical protein
VPSPPPAARAIAVILFGAVGFSACQGSSSPPVPPGTPSGAAVVDGRYARSVELDHRLLLVAPPSDRPSVTVTEDEARAMFEATDAVAGMHEFAILGLGVVTLSPSAEAPPTTTTTSPGAATPTTAPPSPSTTVPSTTAPSTTVPSTTVPSTTAPSTGSATVTSGLPTYDRRLAWVGITWGAAPTCAGAGASSTAMATTTYVVVIIDARTPHRVLSYTSGGKSCAGTAVPPVVGEPNELLSVAWQPVGPGSTAVQIQVPPCGRYFGWTQVPTSGGSVGDQVVVSVPFDPTCSAVTDQSQEVDQVIPLGPDQGLVPHAPVGPVQAFQGPLLG